MRLITGALVHLALSVALTVTPCLALIGCDDDDTLGEQAEEAAEEIEDEVDDAT
jgi:hypothetical protein